MNVFWTRCSTAIAQLLSGDPQLWGIVGVSLSVSASALLIALLPALSTRFMLAYFRFPGRWAAISVLNSLLAVTTVVVGPPHLHLIPRSPYFIKILKSEALSSLILKCRRYVLSFPYLNNEILKISVLPSAVWTRLSL